MNKMIVVLSVSIWLSTVVAGLGILSVYDYTPGRQTRVLGAWPSQSRIPRSPVEPTLIMFAHPHCPCTRASIGELMVLMTHCTNQVKAYIVFFQPKDSDDKWTQTDLWRSAAEIPGVTVLADCESREATAFQATTSGQVMLYDTKGNLLFTGGITESRGHYGDSAGLAAIINLLHGQTASLAGTPVFGCSLLDPATLSLKGGSTCPRL